ncbi:sugar-binding transcriptional regulator [Virgibacillus sp. W0430]|uniref:sugar-binding transcriptional regulator n=1 Tax=Virgibacillus sp. W0430 TaxID=3391580 RepID=UPI003F448663
MDKMDKMNKMDRLVKVAKLYYQLNYSQQKIATELGVSRSLVARLLKEAKEKKVVEIKINDFRQQKENHAKYIKEHFGLKKLMVVNVPKNDNTVIKRYLGEKCANYIDGLVREGDVLGTTWGTTIYEIAKRIPKKQIQDIKIVQLNGGIPHIDSNTFASDIFNSFGRAYNTSPYFLPLPAIFERSEIRDMVMSDRHISYVINLAIKTNIALFTVGDIRKNSTLLKAGYLNEYDMEVLKENKAVGDICSRFIDIDGEICSEELDVRTIGINLHHLREKETSILVAGGEKKTQSIIGALNGGYANVFITDQFTLESVFQSIYNI